jgi:uncharacterized protein involved in outer membrane biogenesis
MRAAWRIPLAVLAGLVLAAGLFALYVHRHGWNWARPLVEKGVGAATGRELDIAGDLALDLGRRIDVTLEKVRFGNVDWAAGGELFAAGRLRLRLRAWPLLRGEVRLEELEVERARLALERDERGRGNWTLRGDARPDDRSRFELPRRLRVRAAEVTLVDPKRPDGFAVRVDALDATRTGGALRAAGEGRYQGQPFGLEAAVFEPPAEGQPSRVDARLAVGATRARARGRLGPRGAPYPVDLALHVEGPSLDAVWTLAGVPLPASPPFALDGGLAWGGDRFLLRDFRARLGRSDLSGDLDVELPASGRMRLVADVHSGAIDLDDVEGFWGRPPREEEDDAEDAPAGAIFPAVPFHFPKLRAADAHLRFTADRVQGRTLLDDVRLDATLERGVLRLQPLELGMSDGELAANAVVDARGDTTRLEADLVLRGVRLERLLERMEIDQPAAGQIGGRAEIRARGNSLDALARSLDGELGSVLQGGRLGESALELLALHLGDYLAKRLSGDDDEQAPIRCLVAVFDAADGRLAARTLMLDTHHLRIAGEGTIDLASERIDLRLEQHSKNFALGSLRTPIEISGPLARREAKLVKGPLAVRGGAAVALGTLVHPLAALLALVDPGEDDQPGACAQALAEYSPIAAKVDAAPRRRPRSR